MSILISILLIVEVLAAFLLIVVILAQKSKDQGLGMAFGSGMGESLFGSRAGNVLTRMTITLSAVFMVTTILLGILFANGKTGSGSVMDKADRQMPVAPMAPMATPQPSAPMMEGDAPIALPVETPAAPMALQMGEGGELAPAEVPAVEEAPAAPAEAPEAAPAP
ncbi:MAG TPA: preprotein translocase subunit SecG [Verrucomicrobia bacterium]|nr:preprotein translocase subunit SecG [Verrucomicrobiota bacterium]